MRSLKLLLMCLVAPFSLFAQNDVVNLFSGDFEYSVPVLYLPSNDGPGVALSASYRSSITMHQKASWIGLGWDVNPGEIRRQTNGVPDDWNGVNRTTNVYTKSGTTWSLSSSETNTTQYFGPIYFKNFGTEGSGTPKEMDSYASGSSGSSFFFPDYDDFIVAAPGISGVMQPLLLDIGTIVKKDETSLNNLIFDGPSKEVSNLSYSTYPPTTFGSNNFCKPFTRSAQFRYLNEYGASRVDSENSNTYKTSSGGPDITVIQSGSDYKAIGSRNVVFYTQTDYIAGTDGLMKYPGFNPSAQNSTDILAFKITDPAGYTYHFALPVYMNSEKSWNFEMDAFNPANALKARVTAIGAFVESWKLTAVTGPDFVDVNGNKEVDSGDKGYWVKYTYHLWVNNFKWQSPYFDANRNFGEDVERIQQYRETYKFSKNNPDSYWGDFVDRSNISTGDVQMYYLDKIETSSHTAFFVKDVRYDEHSKKQGTTTPTPSLLLKRIIVLNNADAALFQSSAALATTAVTSFSPLPASNTTMFHETKYQGNKTNIDSKTISAIEFTYDNSLCKNYPYNILNNLATPTSTSFNFGTGNVDNFTFQSWPTGGVAPTNSGKLTLLGIVPYGLGAVSTQSPPTLFQYSAINPDFHPHKIDIWGNYLSDWSSTRPASYQTATSIPNIEAWHLKKIATPMGSIIEVEYESDVYSKTGGNDGKIARTFGGQYFSGSPDYFLFDDRGLYDLLNSTLVDNVSSITVGYPGWCQYGLQFYNPSMASNFNFVSSTEETIVKRVFTSKTDISYTLDGSQRTRIAKSSGNLNLQAACGRGPGVDNGSNQYNPQSPAIVNTKFGKAIGTVILNSAWGGGVRVKAIRYRETDPNGTARTYSNEYIYENGVASQEPSRFTIPAYSKRSNMSNLYDKHALHPRVGYSRVKIMPKTTDAVNSSADNYTVVHFANFDDKPYNNRGVATFVKDETVLEAASNWSPYFNCTKQPTPPPGGCSGLIPATLTFDLLALNNTGRLMAYDRSFNGEGRVVKTELFDRQNRLLSTSEQEYTTKVSTSQAFHARYHSVIPVSYDAYFLYNSANNQFQDFGPFSSPQARTHSTVYNSNVYYYKFTENALLSKTISTKNDIRLATEYKAFDKYTGAPTLILSKDPSTGETIQKEITYAYTDPNYAEFGPKALSASNRNLLSAVSLERVLKGSELIGGARSTYRKNSIPVRTYNSGTGKYSSSTSNMHWLPWQVFAFNGETDPANWRLQTEYTLFNSKGDPLEMKTFGERYGTVKFGYLNRFVITECSDAKYAEATFSGAEDDAAESNFFGGEVKKSVSGATVETNVTFVHTGKQSLKLAAGTAAAPSKGFEYCVPLNELDVKRRYISRVWVYKNNNTGARLRFDVINRSTGQSESAGYVQIATTDAANNSGYTFNTSKWCELTLNINFGENIPVGQEANYDLYVRCENTVSTVAYFDDFRFHPINSEMTNFVYNTTTGLLDYVLDGNGIYTRFVYDALGRVSTTFVETPQGERKVSDVKRNYYRFSTSTPFN